MPRLMHFAGHKGYGAAHASGLLFPIGTFGGASAPLISDLHHTCRNLKLYCRFSALHEGGVSYRKSANDTFATEPSLCLIPVSSPNPSANAIPTFTRPSPMSLAGSATRLNSSPPRTSSRQP